MPDNDLTTQPWRAAQRAVLEEFEAAALGNATKERKHESLSEAYHARIRAAVARDALEILANAWGLE